MGQRQNIDIINIYTHSQAYITEAELRKITNNSEEKKLYWATLILTIDYGSPTVNQVEIINAMTNNNQHY